MFIVQFGGGVVERSEQVQIRVEHEFFMQYKVLFFGKIPDGIADNVVVVTAHDCSRNYPILFLSGNA